MMEKLKCKCGRDQQPQVKRPRNAFILFRSHQQKLLPQTLHVSEKSKMIAAKWHGMAPKEKQHWLDIAYEEKKKHRELYPDFDYNRCRRKNFTYIQGCHCGAQNDPENSSSKAVESKDSPVSTPPSWTDVQSHTGISDEPVLSELPYPSYSQYAASPNNLPLQTNLTGSVDYGTWKWSRVPSAMSPVVNLPTDPLVDKQYMNPPSQSVRETGQQQVKLPPISSLLEYVNNGNGWDR